MPTDELRPQESGETQPPAGDGGEKPVEGGAPTAAAETPTKDEPAQGDEDPGLFGLDDMAVAAEAKPPLPKVPETEEPPADEKPEPGADGASGDAAIPPAAPPAPPAPDIQAPAQMSQKDFFKAVAKISREAVTEQFGEEFDEFNPEHQAALAVIAPQVAGEMNKHRETQSRMVVADKKAKETINSPEVKEFARTKFESLPYAQAKKILDAEAKGDFDTVLNFLSDCKKEFEEKGSVRKKADEKLRVLKPRSPAAPPPVLEGAGASTSGTETEPDDGLALFGIGG